MQKLENKMAFITGGTSGMGLATARELINQGASVIITSRSQQSINSTLDELGPKAYGFVSDSGKSSDLFSLKEKVKEHTDKIDIVFANAGYGRFSPVENVSEEDFDELFNVLVKGTYFTVQQLLPLMNENGCVILNTSVVTEIGYQNMSVYSAAKSAVQSLIKTFAAEFTAKKIRVNGISPGYTSTNGFEKTGLSSEQIKVTKEAIIPTLPFQRFGTSEEIAKVVSFLVSDDASYVHGAEMVVDGGLSSIK